MSTVRISGSMALVASLLASCGSDAGVDPADLAPPVPCGTVLPGPALLEGAVESQPYFVEELTAMDMTVVPDPFEYGEQTPLFRGMLNYLLGRSIGTSFTRSDIEAAGPLGQVALGAVASTGGTGIDFAFMRRGLYYYYPCVTTIPASLEHLTERYGDYKTWPSVTMECAPPKGTPRRVLENHEAGVYVAETLVTLEGSEIRETEVLFTKLRTDGNLDFAVYTEAGELTDRSTFATLSGNDLVLASPFTCMTCHYDGETASFSIQEPFGTGAGCPTL
jgi:hypothetical protein